MTRASQVSNVAAYMPTDCPTREKHGWLGDALDASEQALYNFDIAAVHRAFMQTIEDNQGAGGDLPYVIPAGIPKNGSCNDIAWTSAYPQIINMHRTYYGDDRLARRHWPSLVRYQENLNSNAQHGLATCDKFEDWLCGVNASKDCCSNNGPAGSSCPVADEVAGFNYVLGLRAMAQMADALGDTTGASRYDALAKAATAEFHAAFFNSALGEYGGDDGATQSLSAPALAIGSPPVNLTSTVVATVQRDLERRVPAYTANPYRCELLRARPVLSTDDPAATSEPRSEGPVPCILDTDIGDDIDDTWALAMLLRSPEIELKYVLTSGSGHHRARARIVAKMLAVAGRSRVRIGLGVEQNARCALRQASWAEEVDLANHPGGVDEDGVGEPDIEHNVANDVEACRAVFQAPFASKAITPLDTCGVVQLTGAAYERVVSSRLAKPDCARGSLALALVENVCVWEPLFLQTRPHLSEVYAHEKGRSSVLFDCAAVGLALAVARRGSPNFRFFKIERLRLDIEDTGFIRERGAAQPGATTQERCVLDVAVGWVDYTAFERVMLDRITG
eukprot:g6108.t1